MENFVTQPKNISFILSQTGVSSLRFDYRNVQPVDTKNYATLGLHSRNVFPPPPAGPLIHCAQRSLNTAVGGICFTIIKKIFTLIRFIAPLAVVM